MNKRSKKRAARQKKVPRSSGQPVLGRPGVNRTFVLETADQFRLMLPPVWSQLAPVLFAARSPDEVTRAFEPFGLLSSSFVPHWSGLILGIVQDRRFPHLRANAQIGFLSDSLGAQGKVTPRRSREICAAEREKEHHFIVRRDFYIECTCGYKGPALRNACPECSTRQLAADLLVEQENGFV